MDNFNQKIDQILSGEKSLSFSSFKPFFKSPRHFYVSQTEPKEVTEAMKEGTSFHMAVLEPEKFENSYWVLDDAAKIAEIGGGNPRATNAYKLWKAELERENEGKEQIKKEFKDNLVFISQYLKKNNATKDLFLGLTEKEFATEFEYDGLKFSGRIDGVGNSYIIDLKKVADADYSKLRYKIKDDYLHVQGAMYCKPKHIKDYYLVFVDLGCNVTVVKLSEETINEGWNMFCSMVENFRSCAEQDMFNYSYDFYQKMIVF